MKKIKLTPTAEIMLKDKPQELLKKLILTLCEYPGAFYYLRRRGLVREVEE